MIPGPAMSKGVVLVVDDEAQIRDILGFYLKRAGFQVLTADNGNSALEAMSKIMPDLILSDLKMPGLAGDELCRIVKGNPATRDIHFVLVSALDGTASKIGGLNLGADDMIAKPFHAQEVMAKVESAFRIIGMQKEIKRQNQELMHYQERMQGELALAERLQKGLLPVLPGKALGLRYTHRYVPAEGIGGDIYTISPLPDGTVALLIADVSGHGVAAALISAMVKASFESQIHLGSDPLAWAEGMNRYLSSNTLSEQFATGFLARIDLKAGEIRYVCAGHNAPFRIPGGSKGGTRSPVVLGGTGFMLGISEDLSFSDQSAPFAAGDRLVLFTDGLVEVEREDRTLLGDEGLFNLCTELPTDGDAAAELLMQKVKTFNGTAPFVDDVTLVVVDSD